MFFDLNVPIPFPIQAWAPSTKNQTMKGKAKPSTAISPSVSYKPAQVAKVEARVDLLVRCYTVIALTQLVESKLDPKSHVNALDPLLGQLRKREGVLFLKRLTIVLDEDSETGFGLTSANANLVVPYDLIALQPTTAASFSLACLTHSVPSPLTAHIISLPLTLPRLPFQLKHTLVRTAIKNGTVFEINYAGALQGESARRNWWASAREAIRVTKGKGVLVSGGIENDAELRAPRDIANIIALLGIGQNLAHDASTTTPKSLVLRAQTRKTYRAVLSEPVLVLPSFDNSNTPVSETSVLEMPEGSAKSSAEHLDPSTQKATKLANSATAQPGPPDTGKKRHRDEDPEATKRNALEGQGNNKKKVKRKVKG